MITAIILTFNEELHIARCLASIAGLVDDVLVVDCYSTDNTIDIALACGARVLQRSWVNYADQFNWALTQLESSTEWVLRIDADEIITSALSKEILDHLPGVKMDVHGISWGRRIAFLGAPIRYGGVFPVTVLRLFRYGFGYCENRWMDEHIKVQGNVVKISGEMLDDNRNTLTWWIDKHNKYACREAVDLLNLDYRFSNIDSIASLTKGGQAGLKRWMKEVLYARAPSELRAVGYFFYRYILRLGFLDGRAGLAFHFLQGLWYRYLVDIKIAEVKKYMKFNDVGIDLAIKNVLNIDIKAFQAGSR